MYQSPEAYAEEAAAVCEQGFEVYKYRPAVGPAEDLRTVELMRKALGSEVDFVSTLMPVANGGYLIAIVEFLAEAIALHDITWLEEPLPVEDREGYSKLKALGYVEIAAGEHEHDFLDFRTLLGRAV